MYYFNFKSKTVHQIVLHAQVIPVLYVTILCILSVEHAQVFVPLIVSSAQQLQLQPAHNV